MDHTLTITGPESTVAALAHLLGFEPSHSLIVCWVGGGRVSLTQRVDLPDVHCAPEPLAEYLVASSVHAHADSAVIVVVEPRGDIACEMPYFELVDAVGAAVSQAGIHLLDALLVEGRTWWSYLCEGACCPPQGRTVSDEASAFVAQCFETLPAHSRSELEAQWQPDHAAIARVEPFVVDVESEVETELATAEKAGCATEALEIWRDAQIEWTDSVLTAEAALSDPELARLLVALCDVRVRDTVIWSIAQVGDTARLVPLLADAVRRAPNCYVAPIATVLGLCCWVSGDGARALIAIELAHADDPDYGLAGLLQYSITHGMPPSSWRQAIAEMPREQCRMPAA